MKPRPQFYVSLIVLILGVFALDHLSHGEFRADRKDYSTFPLNTGSWKGTRDIIEPTMLDAVGCDDYIILNLQDEKGRGGSFYTAFYRSQRFGDRIHTPRGCLPGAGWGFLSSRTEKIDVPGFDEFTVNRIIAQKGQRKILMLFWYQQQGRIVANEYMRKIYMVYDAITRNRTDASLVRIVVPIVKDDEESAFETARDIVLAVEPVLSQYIPD